jgi:Uma2 family endonuclease
MTDLSARAGLMTAEELFAMPDHGGDYELVNGELRVSGQLQVGEPAGVWHGSIAMDLGGELRSYARAERLGLVMTETGFLIRRDPDTVRAPDVAFIGAARVPDLERGERYFDGAPDLAAEIVSPGDSASEIEEKVWDYLASGVRLVWLVYPRSRTVVVWTPDGAGRTLRGDDALDGADVLRGFRLPLAELFASLPNASAPRA